MMGLLLAPEGEGGGGAGGGGAADGQGGAAGAAGGAASGAGAGAADMIPRSEAQKAFEQRDAAKREAREAREQLELERKKAGSAGGGASGKPPEGKPDDDEPKWARELRELTLSVRDELKADKKQQTRKGIVDTILAEVPDGNRGTVEIMLDGLEARGELVLHGDDKTAVARTALAKLKASHATLFVPLGSTRPALQAGADGQYPWDQVQTEADMPADGWAKAPPEVLERLSRPGGRGENMILTSGNRPKPK